jgi:glycosyltransferase involved in cell wall biosynthesis
VLFVLDHFYPYIGGGETLFWELSRTLVRRGHRVTVVTQREPGTPRRESIEGLEIHRVSTPRRLGRYLFIPLAFPTVLRQARKADVIHTILYGAALPAWLAAALLRKPTVLSVYEVFASQWQRLAAVPKWGGWCFRGFEWVLLHLPFHRIICISQFTRHRLAQCAPHQADRASVVYPAVDYEFWDPDRYTPVDLRQRLKLAADTFIFLYFGRPGVSKGVDALVEATAAVYQAVPNSRLVLLLARDPADGYRQIRQRISDLGLRDQVAVLDPVPREELPGYLMAADCVVVPSLSEGFGYSAVEAATLGCRVVATAGHAVEEVLHGFARLVPPDNPRSLAETLVALAKEMPVCSPAPQRYTLDAHIAGVLSVYEQATGQTWQCGQQPCSVDLPGQS